MKELKVILFVSFLALLVTACSFQIPEKISVKSKAEYSFSLGDFKSDIPELKFNADDIFKDVNIQGARFYDYYPNKQDSNTQKFLIKIPLLEIPVDFGEYFSNTNISEAIEKMSFEQEFKVPEVAFTSTQDIPMDVVTDAINKVMNGIPISGLANDNFELIFGFDGNSAPFTSITYKTGSITVDCSGVYGSVSISNGEKTATAFIRNGKAEIDLKDFTIYKEGTVISFSNPNAVKRFDAKISENCEISSVTGLTLPVDDIPLSFDLDSFAAEDDVFKKCTIKTGKLNTKIQLPENWSGVTVSYKLSSTGGITLAETSDAVIDLANTTISTEKSKIKAAIKLELNNATYRPGDTPKFICSSDIKELASVTLALKDVDTKVSKKEKLPAELIQAVKSITLDKRGIKGTFENTLPAGNDIKIFASSDFLALNANKELVAGKNSDFELITESEKIVQFADNPAAGSGKYDSWDFNVNLQLPGYDATNPSLVTVKNVETNKTYKIGFKIEPVINWKKISIDASQAKQNDSTTVDLGLANINKSIDDALNYKLSDKIEIPELPLYLYCTKPEMKSDVFENAKFTGSIKMSVQDKTSKDNIHSETLLKDGDAIKFCNEPKLKLEKNTVISKLDKADASLSVDLSELLKKSTDNSEIKLDYDIAFNNSSDGTIDVTPDILKDNTSSSISIIAILVLPLELKAKEKVTIDLNEMLDLKDNEDVLGRSEASTENDVLDLLDMLEYAEIRYEAKSLPIYSDLTIKMDMGNIGKKDLGMKSGLIRIETSDVKSILETYPFSPKFSIEIPADSTISVPRTTDISMNVTLKIGTNGTYELLGGKK